MYLNTFRGLMIVNLIIFLLLWWMSVIRHPCMIVLCKRFSHAVLVYTPSYLSVFNHSSVKVLIFNIIVQKYDNVQYIIHHYILQCVEWCRLRLCAVTPSYILSYDTLLCILICCQNALIFCFCYMYPFLFVFLGLIGTVLIFILLLKPGHCVAFFFKQ